MLLHFPMIPINSNEYFLWKLLKFFFEQILLKGEIF